MERERVGEKHSLTIIRKSGAVPPFYTSFGNECFSQATELPSVYIGILWTFLQFIYLYSYTYNAYMCVCVCAQSHHLNLIHLDAAVAQPIIHMHTIISITISLPPLSLSTNLCIVDFCANILLFTSCKHRVTSFKRQNEKYVQFWPNWNFIKKNMVFVCMLVAEWHGRTFCYL